MLNEVNKENKANKLDMRTSNQDIIMKTYFSREVTRIIIFTR